MVEGKSPLLSIDVGGTKVRFVKYSSDLKPISKITIPTQEIFQTHSVQDLGNLFIKAGSLQSNETHFQTVGLSMKGAIKNGQIIYASLLGGAEGTEVEPFARQQLKFNKFNILNDVVAMTKAELAYGSVQKSRSLLYVNLGTGIRLCYAENGIVMEGSNGCAGEIGPLNLWSDELHQNLPLESVVSGKGLSLNAERLTGEPKLGEEIFRDNDNQVIEFFSKYLHTTIHQGIHFYNPEAIIFGGSVTLSADKWLAHLKQNLNKLPQFQQPKFIAVSTVKDPASLGVIL